MESLTIKLDEATARWLEAEAAARGTSPSDVVVALLRKRMPVPVEEYEAAMESFLRRPPRDVSSEGGYPTRDEVHEREKPFRSEPPGE